MLTRRTNVLLDEYHYNLISQLAAQKNISMGEIIRNAITKYPPLKKRRTKIDLKLKKTIQSGWKMLKKPQIPLDYKSLTHYEHHH